VDKRGAKIICVDPRFTQSAAKAHLYATSSFRNRISLSWAA